MGLKRSSSNKVIAGVCAGFAETLGIPAKTVRLIFVLLVLFAGLSLWTYIIAWLLMDEE